MESTSATLNISEYINASYDTQINELLDSVKRLALTGISSAEKDKYLAMVKDFALAVKKEFDAEIINTEKSNRILFGCIYHVEKNCYRNGNVKVFLVKTQGDFVLNKKQCDKKLFDLFNTITEDCVKDLISMFST